MEPVPMFDSNMHDSEDKDMELSSIDAANFDAMMAEEAILDWLVNLESDDTDYEMAEAQNEARVAN